MTTFSLIVIRILAVGGMSAKGAMGLEGAMR